ncbi:hypothetical protein ACJIZ3_020000 [Penstemon smallii]|uniref:Uncharacterized protein n=1 Tax=Penstemon smallii TaxID=265156 RepID=A0ABD3SHC5_9LAMI
MNMGVKRPLEQVYFPELSFKQPKQLDYGNRLTLSTEDFPSQENNALVYSPGEVKSNFSKLHSDGTLQNGGTNCAALTNKELEASVPSSLTTSSGSEEDVGNEDSSFWSYLPSYIDFTVPRRQSEEFEDPCISTLNYSPKEVPIGPDHQAEVPQWDPNACRKDSSGSKCFIDNDRDNKLMGTCVISMPDLNDTTIDGARVGCGRTDCSCLDVGSMRCIQQHVKEARENYRKTLGEDKFKELGFYDIGEEVASNWTADDENIFHEVIFSNPVSHGRNFWKYLSAVFPSRTFMEIVSYYFNVFMLRKRAVQNRSYFLEIDSDDDEEPKGAHVDYDQNISYLLKIDSETEKEQKGAHSDFYQHKPYFSDLDTYDEYNAGVFKVPRFSSYLVSGEDEDPTVESFGDRDLDTGWIDDESLSKPEYNDGMSDGNVCEKDTVEMDGGRDRTSGQEDYEDQR